MDRRRFVLTSLVGALAGPHAARAQQAEKVYRIGWLGIPRRGVAEHLVQPFEQALRERGWVTGKNLVIEYRWAEGKYDRLPALAAELVRLEPKLIVAPVTAAARAAKGATSIIPIVMVTASDPVGDGLIGSLARPGGNVTGLTLTPTSEIWAKQLQLLGEVVPHARRVAFLWNEANTAATRGARTVEEAARSLGVELQVVGVRAPEEFEPAFRAMTQARAEALLVLADGMLLAHRARLANLALVHRLPTVFATKEYADAGGLMSYGADYPDLFRRAAMYVDRILRGATPAALPVEQPTKFELVINLKTAKALGITIPPSLLARADQILE